VELLTGTFFLASQLGVPAFFGFLLSRYRTRLTRPGIRVQLGFLYEGSLQFVIPGLLKGLRSKFLLCFLLVVFACGFVSPLNNSFSSLCCSLL